MSFKDIKEILKFLVEKIKEKIQRKIKGIVYLPYIHIKN
jgi:hypothetical protein